MSDQGFLERHKVFRRISLLWAMFIITDVTYVVFADVRLINSAVVAALSVTVGLLATVIGFYTHIRAKEDTQVRAFDLEVLAYQDLVDDERENHVADNDPH